MLLRKEEGIRREVVCVGGVGGWEEVGRSVLSSHDSLMEH